MITNHALDWHQFFLTKKKKDWHQLLFSFYSKLKKMNDFGYLRMMKKTIGVLVNLLRIQI